MKRIVLKFGLLAGGVLALVMVVSQALAARIDFEGLAVIGYTTMLLAFLMIFFGVRTYRDTVLDGRIAFGRAFKVGIMITAIASACYVVTWEILVATISSDFAQQYADFSVKKAREAGASAEQLAAKEREMKSFVENYRNPFYRAPLTFLEPLPVGLLVTLVCAGALSRKKGVGAGSTVTRATASG